MTEAIETLLQNQEYRAARILVAQYQEEIKRLTKEVIKPVEDEAKQRCEDTGLEYEDDVLRVFITERRTVTRVKKKADLHKLPPHIQELVFEEKEMAPMIRVTIRLDEEELEEATTSA